MKIKLFQFNKKLNSTKHPTGGVEYDITLKEGCNIINPAVNFSRIANPTAYNYAYIPDFGRYYFVSNWEAYRDRWTASLAVDVLASYKQQIGASSQYIGRAESESNGDIADGMYPTICGIKYEQLYTTTDRFVNRFTDGTYVIGIANGVETTTGVCYYITGHAGMSKIRSQIMGDKNLLNLIAAGTINPGQYILSCKWYPLPLETFLASVEVQGRVVGVNYGPFGLPVAAEDNINILLSETFEKNWIIPIDYSHPQINRGSYLNSNPYTSIFLQFPPFGLIDINCSQLYNASRINARISIDLITGYGELILTRSSITDTGIVVNPIMVQTAMIALDVPLNSNSINLGGIVSNGIAAAKYGSDVISYAAIADNAKKMREYESAIRGEESSQAGVFSSIISAAESAIPMMSTVNGSSGSMAPYNSTVALYAAYQLITDENPDLGRPLCAMRTVNTMSGFVQIPDPHFDIAATDGEKIEIERAARAGFFYE